MILKDRDWLIRVAGAELRGIDIEFEIKKTLRPEPNTCSLTIYNLKPETRNLLDSLNLYDPRKSGASLPRGNVAASAKVAKAGRIRVEIEAGYKGERSLLFRGDLRRAISEREGASWRTTIEGEDGGHSVLAARVSETFPAGTPKLSVIRKCAEAMGVGLGNIAEVADLLTGVYDKGTLLDGSAPDELKGVLRRIGLVYSIQNGVLQFQRAGFGTGDIVRALLLSEQSGLVGSPKKDATGELIATSLLVPNVSVGGYVSLFSQVYKGVYRTVGVTHKGSTFSTDWYHILNLVPG